MTWGGERLEYSYGPPERVFMGGYPPHGIGIILRESMGGYPPHEKLKNQSKKQKML